jgi:mRNA-degrading endonuclease toxin of MazEF toxin-antitoxin module
MVFWGEVGPAESRDSEHFHPRDNPCLWVVYSVDDVHRKLPIVQAIPLTSKLEKDQGSNFRFYRIRLFEAQHFVKYEVPRTQPGFEGDSLALTEQLRVFAHDRLMGNPVAKVTTTGLAAIEAGVRFVLDIP